MAREFNDDRKKNLNFKDSWLQNSVELAAAGAIVAGAGTLAVKGDFTDAVRTGKRGLQALGKGFDKYVKRNASPGARFGYNVSKKTFLGLKRLPRDQEGVRFDEYRQLFRKNIKHIDEDPETQERIRKEVTRRLGNRVNRNIVDDAIDKTNKSTNTDLHAQARYIYEQVRNEEINKALGLAPSGKNSTGRSGTNNNNNNQEQGFDRRKLMNTALTSAVVSGASGIALGAGVSGFHAFDRAVSNPDAQKNLEESFQIAGTWLGRRSDRELDKNAGALETYNTLKQIVRKTPEAVASGIGFTGVSLGAAHLLNQKRKEEEAAEAAGAGPRVIIELGNQTQDEESNNLGRPPSIGALPKLSNEYDDGFQKLALRSPAWLGNFGRDLRGYSDEIQNLKNMNYDDQAAELLKNENVDDLVKQRYGNLVNDKTQAQFTKSLFDSTSQGIKRDADEQIRDLETRTAKARLQAGAGALGVGGGLAGLAILGNRRNDEDGRV